MPCYDPGTMQSLGTMPAMNAREVRARVARAKEAQVTWAKSSFEQRRQLLRILLRYILDHQEDICRCVLPVCGCMIREVERPGRACRQPLVTLHQSRECPVEQSALGWFPARRYRSAAIRAVRIACKHTLPYYTDIQLHPAAPCTQPAAGCSCPVPADAPYASPTDTPPERARWAHRVCCTQGGGARVRQADGGRGVWGGAGDVREDQGDLSPTLSSSPAAPAPLWSHRLDSAHRAAPSPPPASRRRQARVKTRSQHRSKVPNWSGTHYRRLTVAKYEA